MQKGITHSSGALQRRSTNGRRHTRETTETGACDYCNTGRSWKGRRNEKGGKIVAYFLTTIRQQQYLHGDMAALRIHCRQNAERAIRPGSESIAKSFARLLRCADTGGYILLLSPEVESTVFTLETLRCGVIKHLFQAYRTCAFCRKTCKHRAWNELSSTQQQLHSIEPQGRRSTRFKASARWLR